MGLWIADGTHFLGN